MNQHGTRYETPTATDVGDQSADARDGAYPKIELHVHLEATVAPKTLLQIAKRNDYPLPATTVEELSELYRCRDFDHFIEVWILTTDALRHYDDFRQVVVDYAQQARGHGAVYIDGIFSPIERVWRGVDWDEIFAGYCDGRRRRGSCTASRSASLPTSPAARPWKMPSTPFVTRSSTTIVASSASAWAATRTYTRRSRLRRPFARPNMVASARCRAPAKSWARSRFAARSRTCKPTASATASERPRIPAYDWAET